MRVIGREYLEEFLKQNNLDRTDADIWLYEASVAQWHSYRDIEEQYVNADYFPDNIFIFKLNGIDCQLETKVSFNNKIILIENVKSTKDTIKRLF